VVPGSIPGGPKGEKKQTVSRGGPPERGNSTVQQDLAALLELQKLDLENLELRKETKELPAGIEEMRGDVARVGDLLERERERLAEAEQWRDNREKEIELQNELLTKSKTKLQAARNEKEYKAAQREIDTIRKTIQERENEALEVMKAIDQYRGAIEEHTSEFGELESHLEASRKEAEQRMDEVEKEIAETADRRLELASRVPDRLLRLYERIHKRLGTAIVEAADGTCTGCNMEILPQSYIELQRGDKLIQCANCHRILIYRGERDAEAEQA
jgi:uncharacterized protein